MKTFILISFVLFLCFSNSAYTQTKAQREVIKQSMSSKDSLKAVFEIEKYSAERKERINKFLEKNPKEKQQFQKNGKIYLLYDVTKKGKPIYHTLKDVIIKNKRNSKSSIKK